MSRVINPDGVGKERKRYTRAIAIALRELSTRSETDTLARDLAAFILLALEAVAETIERTVAPWEKRGYWLKADRFRLEWGWAAQYAADLRKALSADQWGEVALIAAKIAEKLSGEKIPRRHRLGKPWLGAWEKYLESERRKFP